MRASFFDLDETIYDGKSLLEFGVYAGILESPTDPRLFSADTRSGTNRALANKRYYRLWEGLAIEEMVERAEAWASTRRSDPEAFFQPVIDALLAHAQEGFGIVIVTGSPSIVAEALLREAPIDHILSPVQEHRGGRYTGNLNKECIGEAKLERIRDFAKVNEVDLDKSWGYGDDLSDFPMLESVGSPVVVTLAHSKALKSAESRQWKVIG